MKFLDQSKTQINIAYFEIPLVLIWLIVINNINRVWYGIVLYAPECGWPWDHNNSTCLDHDQSFFDFLVFF